ncbi:phosphonopyruvate decarboxylase [Candidatus Nomurabacteria bacterium]|nr:phosphonopyruvate decarboxylase [Candidatus Nomurabacteria bacterium]
MDPKQFLDTLAGQGITFFTGVPDSLLKEFISCIEATVPRTHHITAANEGNAIALAAGYQLATGAVPAVYLQNSGLGNAVNPLTSLADKEVYAIPMLLIVGWRGEPGVKDEPQHIKQGRITPALLDILEIPRTDKLDEVGALIERAKAESRPVALVVHADAFSAYPTTKAPAAVALTREAAIESVIAALNERDIVVSTTGKISRELYEVRKRTGQPTKDFLTVGSMGHASQIALGIASQKPDRRVVCLDGDGATIMHMGALATAGLVKPNNFLHIVLNNKAHESVGGQPSAAGVIDIPAVARACGYTTATATTVNEIGSRIGEYKNAEGPHLLEIMVNLESRKDLARPAETPAQNKRSFIDHLHGTN